MPLLKQKVARDTQHNMIIKIYYKLYYIIYIPTQSVLAGLHLLALLSAWQRQAPFRWRHARLASLKQFLKQKVAEGAYHPIITTGLGDFD